MDKKKAWSVIPLDEIVEATFALGASEALVRAPSMDDPALSESALKGVEAAFRSAELDRRDKERE